MSIVDIGFNMATNKKGFINRTASPMKLVEESYDQKPKILELRKKRLGEGQSRRSSFLIGSIEEVNHKISKLDKTLQSYTDLVIDSRASDDDSVTVKDIEISSDQGREIFHKREKEAKDINKFAGVYSIKSTFTPGMSEGLKQISALSINQNKTSPKVDSRKPMLVEVHTYPGYDSNRVTNLPHDTDAMDILCKVTDTYMKLNRKTAYKPEFERLFYSPMSQAILQDTFWWFWLENYMKNSKHYQAKLFNRVSHNYVKLLTYANQSSYHDTFFNNYAELLTQSVFAAFCSCFPHSLHQFNMNFRENLVNLVFDWINGVRPAPRTWMKWNLEKLEPKGIKLNDDTLVTNKSNDKASALNLDFMDSMVTESKSALNPSVSSSSQSSLNNNLHSNSSSRTSLSNDPSPLRRVSDAQTAGSFTDKKKVKLTKKKSRRGRLGESEVRDLLTPIRELHSEDAGTIKSLRKESNVLQQVTSPTGNNSRKMPKESHPVGKGPSFAKKAFNLFGQSPLVAHFMKVNNLEREAGLTVRVQRTEMENLPALNSLTYRQFINTSFKSINQFAVAYQGLVDRNKKDHSEFLRKLQHNKEEFRKREVAMMSKPREMKRLSELLMMELKRDEDSIGTGTKAAIELTINGE